MKKLLAMLLVLAMISCLFVACANNDSETDDLVEQLRL